MKENMKKDITGLIVLFVVVVALFKILFYREQLGVIVRVVASFFWLFVIPGFILVYYWYDKFDFLARLLIGIALSAAVVGIGSYYLGLLDIHVRYHVFVFPPAMIGFGLALFSRKQLKMLWRS